jgi:trimeric autotransporter adhesin
LLEDATATNAGAVYDRFGLGLALSGDTLAAGASFEDSAAQGVGGNHSDDSAVHSGAVYMFRRSGSEWRQDAYVKESNTGMNDEFGHAVALSGDTLAIGARLEDSNARAPTATRAPTP